MAPPANCPNCTEVVYQEHCKNPKCDWWVCRGCDSYGSPSRDRWVAGKKKGA